MYLSVFSGRVLMDVRLEEQGLRGYVSCHDGACFTPAWSNQPKRPDQSERKTPVSGTCTFVCLHNLAAGAHIFS